MIPPATSIQEIYQQYFRGLDAVRRLFERVFESVSLYGSPSEDQQEQSLRMMSEEIDRLKAQIENQRAGISRLRHRNHELERRNSELETTLVVIPEDRIVCSWLHQKRLRASDELEGWRR